MNNFSAQLSRTVITLIAALFLSACSESEKQGEELPLLVERMQFTFIQEDTLFSFDPESNTKEAVSVVKNETNNQRETITVRSDAGLILTLDTDESVVNRSDSDNGIVVEHTPAPEYVVYVLENELYLYDLITRYNHNLGKVPGDQFICDIRASRILESNARQDETRLIKDDRGFFVRSASNEACDTDVTYYRVVVRDSEDEDDFFTRRTLSYGEHSHIATHQHTHDEDHSHDHLYEDGHVDQNGFIFDSEFHAHAHTHEHEIQYLHEHAHDYLSKQEIDEVHNNPNIWEYTFTDHPLLRASFRSASEAQMYSTPPLTKLDTVEEFGYLGFNASNNCLEFFQYDTDDSSAEDPLRKSLWAIDITRPSNFQKFNCSSVTTNTDPVYLPYLETVSGLIFEINDSLYELPNSAIFEDDDIAVRAERIRNPIFSGSEFYIDYEDRSNRLVITEYASSINVYLVETPGPNLTPSPLISYDRSRILSANSRLLDGTVHIYKRFQPNQCSGTVIFECFSFVRLGSNGQEEIPIIRQNTEQIYFQWPDKFPWFTYGMSDDANNVVYAQGIRGNQTLFSASEGKLNSFWATHLDMRSKDFKEDQAFIGLVTADSVTRSMSENLFQYGLENPDLYLKNLETLESGLTGLIGTIPTTVTGNINLVIVNELYGYVVVDELREDLEIRQKVYFFPVSKSYINPTGEIGDMQLLYEIVN